MHKQDISLIIITPLLTAQPLACFAEVAQFQLPPAAHTQTWTPPIAPIHQSANCSRSTNIQSANTTSGTTSSSSRQPNTTHFLHHLFGRNTAGNNNQSGASNTSTSNNNVSRTNANTNPNHPSSNSSSNIGNQDSQDHAFANTITNGNSQHFNNNTNSTFLPSHSLWLADHSARRLWSNTTPGSAVRSPSINLDLSSTNQNMTAGHLLHAGSVTIDVGGTNLTVNAQTQLTPAEYIAVEQVTSGRQQSLILDSYGSATGGSVIIGSHLGSMISSLIIPKGVTVIDLTKSGTINLQGNITDDGNLYLTSGNQLLNSITIDAKNINVQAQGLLSDVLPVGLIQVADTNPDLSLTASHDITNAGTITSGGALSLTAGGSISNASPSGVGGTMPTIQAANDINLASGSGNVINGGLIASTKGNINVSSPVAGNDISINASGGTFQAINGNINVRDASYTGSANIDLNGGNFLSQNLNLYTGSGSITGVTQEVTGNWNSVAGSEHIAAITNNLILGNNTVSGDPTFVSTGNIDINGSNTFGENVAIIAEGNIVANSSGAIVDQGNSVTLIAGATVTTTGTGNSGTTNIPGTTLNINGGSGTSNGTGSNTASVDFTTPTGGNIDFSSSTASTIINTSSSSGNGGNVTLVALANGGTGGAVTLLNSPTLSAINTSGTGSGNGGNVTIFAGADSGTAITTGAITSSGGSSGGSSGSVTLSTTQAVTSDGNPLVFNANGSITSGNSIQNGSTLQAAGITTGEITTGIAGGSGSAGNVNISAYGNINVNTSSVGGGAIEASNNGSGSGGVIALVSANGTIQTGNTSNPNNGEITSRSNGAGTGGSVTVSAVGNISIGGGIHTDNTNTGGGSGGSITLESSTGSITTYDITSTIVDSSGSAGNIILLASGSISTHGDSINASQGSSIGAGSAGSVTLVSSTGSITIGGINTNVTSPAGTGIAGNVIVWAPADSGGINAASIDAYNNGTSAGGSVALASGGPIANSNNEIRVDSATSGNSGSVYISSGFLGSGPISTGTITLNGGALLATTAEGGESSSNISLRSFTSGNSLAVGGQNIIYSTATYSSFTVLPAAFSNGASITPVTIPGGGFTSFSNTGTVALNNDTITAGTAISFNTLVPILVQSQVTALGTINDTTGAGQTMGSANFYLIAPSVSIGSQITYESTGNLSILANQISTSGITTTGATVTLTGVQGITTANIDTTSSGSYPGAAVTLVAGGGSVTTGTIDTYVTSGAEAAGNVTILADGDITTSGGGIVTMEGDTGTGNCGNINLSSSNGSISLAAIETFNSNASNQSLAGNVTVSAYDNITVAGTIDTHNHGSNNSGSITLTSSNGSVSVSGGSIYTTIDNASSPGAAGSITVSALDDIAISVNPIQLLTLGSGAAGSVLINSTNGSITVSGDIQTSAGSGDTGANGGNVTMTAQNNISISTIEANGGSGSYTDTTGNAMMFGNGGNGGAISLTATTGTISSGAITANGGSGNGTDSSSGGGDSDYGIGGDGGVIQLTAGSYISCTSPITSIGGTGSSTTTNMNDISYGTGGAGNTIQLIASGSDGSGNSISVVGLSSTGGNCIAGEQGGGAGGNITLSGTSGAATAAAININGSISSNGGNNDNDMSAGPGNGGTAGPITITSGTTIAATGVSITANGGSNADPNSTGMAGDGATITLAATSQLQATTIETNGSNGGTINLQSNGTITTSGAIQAEGTTGDGGLIQFASFVPGDNPVTVTNTGTVNATNNANNSGIVGFNGGPDHASATWGAVTVTGSGSITGHQVNIGNLNNNTLQIYSPFFTVTSPAGSISNMEGNISVTQQGSVTAAGTINVSGTALTPTPSPTPTVTPAAAAPALAQVQAAALSTGLSPQQIFFYELSYLSLLQSLQQQVNTKLYEQIGTKIATDNTHLISPGIGKELIASLPGDWLHPVPLPNQTNNTSLEGYAKFDQHENEARQALFAASEFNANELAALANQGIAFGPRSDNKFFDLVKGFVLFMPTNNISVQTREGIVNIPKGAQVWIMETGADAAIYDLHDSPFTGYVKIVANKKELTLSPGKEVLLTRNATASFESLNPGRQFGYRNLRSSDLGEGIKAYVADFSIAHGLSNVAVINSLVKSNDPAQRKAVWHMIKNAVILDDLTGSDYKLSP